jgi:hypothetical protein
MNNYILGIFAHVAKGIRVGIYYRDWGMYNNIFMPWKIFSEASNLDNTLLLT